MKTSSLLTSLHERWMTPRVMAGNRGDDIVLAGSRGQQASATLSGLFDQTHRSTSLILAIDCVIIVLICQQISSISQSYLGRIAMLIWVVPLFVSILTWFSYRSRRAWAYWPGALILSVAAVIFFIFFLQYLFLVISGAVGGLLFMLIMGYASYSSFQRVRYHFSPLYRKGYTEFVPMPEVELEEGEMLAACPHCMAVLAIRPDLLSPSDTCPHCKQSLVSKDLARRHGWKATPEAQESESTNSEHAGIQNEEEE